VAANPAVQNNFGVVLYSAARGRLVVKDLISWLTARDVNFVRVGRVDSGGVLRVEAQTIRHLASALENGLPMVPAVQAALPLNGVADIPELSAVGQVWLVPDLETARVLPWEPNHASCLGSFVETGGTPWTHCPRAALDRAVAALAARGLVMQAAFAARIHAPAP
jgi:glutamine synthetase